MKCEQCEEHSKEYKELIAKVKYSVDYSLELIHAAEQETEIMRLLLEEIRNAK